jgi:hypothetical protein
LGNFDLVGNLGYKLSPAMGEKIMMIHVVHFTPLSSSTIFYLKQYHWVIVCLDRVSYIGIG